MRGSNKENASNYLFRLVQICVYKESEELFFKKPLWLIVGSEIRIVRKQFYLDDFAFTDQVNINSATISPASSFPMVLVSIKTPSPVSFAFFIESATNLPSTQVKVILPTAFLK